MKIRKKNFLILILVFVLLCYFLINYFNPIIFYEYTASDKNYDHHQRKHHKHQHIIPNNVQDKNGNDNNSLLNNNKNEKNEKIRVNQNELAKSKINSKMRFYALDGNGLGSVNTGVTKCYDGIEVEVTNDINKADFSYFLNSVPTVSLKSHYYMVYAMESEPHSGGGDTWQNADFRMWYNLDLSYPEPATYFDVRSFLPDLLSKPTVEFESKENSAPLVWILSNCAAFNGRESYVRKLMQLVSIDSFGGCLKNKNTHTGVRMMGNIELYSKYKFVLAIENSNCEDYVTEKLVHAVASGSIPIVAGRDGKPDYLRYMPKNSYINVYDFKTVEDLANHIKKIMTDKPLYEKYIYFKKNHNYTKSYLLSLKLPELINVAKTIIDPIENEQFFNGIVGKEKSEDKLCKIARYIKNTPKDVLDKEIKQKKINRPSTGEACLPSGNLANDFK